MIINNLNILKKHTLATPMTLTGCFFTIKISFRNLFVTTGVYEMLKAMKPDVWHHLRYHAFFSTGCFST